MPLKTTKMGEISKKYQHNKDEVIYEDGTRQQQYQANPHPIGTALTQSEECGQGRTPKQRRRRRLETIADTSQSHKILPTTHHGACERLSLTHIVLMSRLLSLSTGCCGVPMPVRLAGLAGGTAT